MSLSQRYTGCPSVPLRTHLAPPLEVVKQRPPGRVISEHAEVGPLLRQVFIDGDRCQLGPRQSAVSHLPKALERGFLACTIAGAFREKGNERPLALLALLLNHDRILHGIASFREARPKDSRQSLRH